MVVQSQISEAMLVEMEGGKWHCYHHRGLLIVYLRLPDVPVGPGADEDLFKARINQE